MNWQPSNQADLVENTVSPDLNASACVQAGCLVQPAERGATTLERQLCLIQKVQLDSANEKQAGRVAAACELLDMDEPSSEASAVARKKNQVCNRFNIDPAELTAQHIFDIGRTFSALCGRLLDNNATTLGLFAHGC